MAYLIPYNRPGKLLDDSFFRPFFGNDFFSGSLMRVDVRDLKDHYLLEADIPGVPQDQVNLTVDDGVLTIEANVNKETREENERYIYSERRSGRMQRSFNLTGIDETGIQAQYSNGVLTVTLPKAGQPEAPKARNIPIN